MTGRSGRCTFATCLKQGFQVAEDEAPAAPGIGDRAAHLGRGDQRALQFVGERQPAHAAGPGSISLVTRVKPSASIWGVNRRPGLDELAGWVELQHIAVKNPGRRDRRRAVRHGRHGVDGLGPSRLTSAAMKGAPAAARSVRPPAAIDSGRRSTDVRMAQLMRQNARTLAPV